MGNLSEHIKRLIPYQRHSNHLLQTAWDVLQLAVIILPFSSLLSGLGFLIAAIDVWRHYFYKIIHRPINRGFVVLSALLLLSSVLAFRCSEAFLGLLNFLPFFFVFAALSELVQTTAQMRRLAWLLVSTSVLVAAIGLGQYFLGLAGRIEILAILLDWTIDLKGNPPGRMSSVFSYATVLASYLVITFTLSLGLWIEAALNLQRLKTKKNSYSRLPTSSSLPHLLFLSLALVSNGIALILTNSRNAWAIALISCFAFALYLCWYWLLAGVSAVATAVLAAAFGPSFLQRWLRRIVPAFFWARLTDQMYPDRPIAQLRTTQWKFAWSLAQQRPATGWGLRNFSPIYETQMHYFIGHPHNFFLMLASETGFITAILFFVLVGWIVLQGTLLLTAWVQTSSAKLDNNDRDQLIFFSYLLTFMGCTLFSLLDITFFDVRINLLGWLLLAAICGAVYRWRGRVMTDAKA